MGANKTETVIGRASKASGGVTKIVEALESQTNMRPKSSAHSHRSSAEDERVIIKGYWQPKFLLCYLKVLTHLRMNMVLIPRQSLLFKSYSYLNSPKF